MKNHILTFSKFINESRYYSYTGIVEDAKAIFKDFKFEEPVPILINDIDTLYLNLKEKYVWNRESRSYHKDHFALNVKVYVWPEQDKVRELINDPKASEERVNHIWWQWFRGQQEVLVDGIDYAWVRDTGFGGKSGGWLLLTPDVTDSEVFETIEETINEYKARKERLMSPTDIEHFKKYETSTDYSHLTDIGLVAELEPLNELKEAVEEIVVFLDDTKARAERKDTDMQAILAQVANFRQHAVEWFYEYLKTEYSPEFIYDDEYYN